MNKFEQVSFLDTKRSEFIRRGIVQALECFGDNNDSNQPDQIVIYRDGVGGEQFQEKYLERELPELQKIIY